MSKQSKEKIRLEKLLGKWDSFNFFDEVNNFLGKLTN